MALMTALRLNLSPDMSLPLLRTTILCLWRKMGLTGVKDTTNRNLRSAGYLFDRDVASVDVVTP